MSVSWDTKWRWDTVYSADSVEWCPVEGYHDVLVCGTYQLDTGDSHGEAKPNPEVEETATHHPIDEATVEEFPSVPTQLPEEHQRKQKRLGKIHLFTIQKETSELSPVQTIDTSGVLDQKWCYHLIDDHPVLGIATSDGKLQFYQLVKNKTIKLEFWVDYTIGEDVLALSLDWSNNRLCDTPKIIVSDSSGCVTVLVLFMTGHIEKIGTWKGHSFEAWVGAFHYWHPDTFYSGGDDSVLKIYDMRMPDDKVVQVNRVHEAGVTAIRAHMEYDHLLLTGSYDEKVRLWDVRALRSCVYETNVKGGVWRLKWHPDELSVFLAACMYGGFRIIKNDYDINGLNVIGEYNAHKSIAYGADWKFGQDYNTEKDSVATCSFYDCMMHISEVDMPRTH